MLRSTKSLWVTFHITYPLEPGHNAYLLNLWRLLRRVRIFHLSSLAPHLLKWEQYMGAKSDILRVDSA
jgi:hypothetical protein